MAKARQPGLLQCVEALQRRHPRSTAKEIMKALFALSTLAGLFAASPAVASPELAQQKTCMACHAVDRKLVGPSYKDVAAKYASQKDAATATLAEKIMKGGVGVWGPVPMPANPKVSPAEARQLAIWVLGIK
jgi:cytochrome c